MNKYLEKYVSKDPSSLINSVLFLLIGIILFANPNGIISFISYIIGIVVIIVGVVKILSAVKNKGASNYDSNLTIGIICAVVGVILIFCGSIIELVFRFFIGGWILLSGVNKLVNALNLKNVSDKWKALLVISILLIIIGLYVILRSNLVFSSIGLIMIIYSSISIISYFMTPKQKNKDVIK